MTITPTSTTTVLTAAMTVLLALALVSCGHEEPPQPGATLTVSTMKVEPGRGPRRFAYAGTVEGKSRITVSTKLMGVVSSVPYDVGARVRAGDVILSLRSDDLRAKKAQVEAGRAEAGAAFTNVSANFERIKGLYERQSATRKEMDDIRMAYDMAQAKVRSVDEMGKEIDDLLRYADIAAPFSGTIVGKYIEPGDLANPGMPLLALEDTRELRIGFSVPESEISSVRKGDRVSVAIDAAGGDGRRFGGVIGKVNPSGDPASRQYRAQALLDEAPTAAVRTGMFASVEVEGGGDGRPASGEGSIAVPDSVIVRRGQLDGVFVLTADGEALLRWVRTGARLPDGRVEVLSGLAGGEVVITTSDPRIADGVRVGVDR